MPTTNRWYAPSKSPDGTPACEHGSVARCVVLFCQVSIDPETSPSSEDRSSASPADQPRDCQCVRVTTSGRACSDLGGACADVRLKHSDSRRPGVRMRERRDQIYKVSFPSRLSREAPRRLVHCRLGRRSNLVMLPTPPFPSVKWRRRFREGPCEFA